MTTQEPIYHLDEILPEDVAGKLYRVDGETTLLMLTVGGGKTKCERVLAGILSLAEAGARA